MQKIKVKQIDWSKHGYKLVPVKVIRAKTN